MEIKHFVRFFFHDYEKHIYTTDIEVDDINIVAKNFSDSCKSSYRVQLFDKEFYPYLNNMLLQEEVNIRDYYIGEAISREELEKNHDDKFTLFDSHVCGIKVGNKCLPVHASSMIVPNVDTLTKINPYTLKKDFNARSVAEALNSQLGG